MRYSVNFQITTLSSYIFATWIANAPVYGMGSELDAGSPSGDSVVLEQVIMSGDAVVQKQVMSGDAVVQKQAMSGDEVVQKQAMSGDAVVQKQVMSGDAVVQKQVMSGDAVVQKQVMSGDAVVQKQVQSSNSVVQKQVPSRDAVAQKQVPSGDGFVQVKLPSKIKTTGDINVHKRAEGCYGPTQLQDMLALNTSRIKYKPRQPSWCSERKALIPEYLSSMSPQKKEPPYTIRVYPFKKSEVFRVVLKAVGPKNKIKDAIMVARNVDKDGTVETNHGRFIQSEGVVLICCFFTDKDVARFQTIKDDVKQVVFYWVPYEEAIDDHEGRIIFIATVAKNFQDYWINVTSDIVDVIPPTFEDD